MLTRRAFMGGMAAGLGWTSLPFPAAHAASAARALSPEQRRWLLATLAKQDARYDPFARMLVMPAGAPGYHTTLKSGDVHGTRPSLIYAAALLDTGVPERLVRAREIIQAILALQDQDPDSKTYGLWPWYLEEPLTKMSPPDWNWADCCAMPLLMAWIQHRHTLGNPLADDVRLAIGHAARSIQLRDVAPSYTSMAVLGTGVTLLAAQEFQQADLRAYAKARLRRLHAHVIAQGSFGEYNCPTLSIVTLQEFSRMQAYVKDARDRALVSALEDLAWQHVATHFHAPTRQWAGPHSRCDQTDLRRNPATLAFLQVASQGRVDFKLGDPLPLSLEARGLPLEAPPKSRKLFARLVAPRLVSENFVRAAPATAGMKNPVIGITWLHPRFTIGSINRGDFWAQRRPLAVYWGNSASCRFLRLRCLKDDHDFSSALFFSTQHEGALLAAIGFATDYGDSHPTLDPIDHGMINAHDLRLRFEFGGDLQDVTVRRFEGLDEAILIQDRDCRFLLRPIAGGFGGKPVHWDSPPAKLADHLDAVIHAGDGTPVALSAQPEAFLCFALQEWPYDEKNPAGPAIEFKRVEGQLQLRWNIGGQTLELAGPMKPDRFTVLNDAFSTRIASGMTPK